MICSKCEAGYIEDGISVSESGHRIAAALYLSDWSDLSDTSDKAPERIRS